MATVLVDDTLNGCKRGATTDLTADVSLLDRQRLEEREFQRNDGDA
jgi:hypothetical protein